MGLLDAMQFDPSTYAGEGGLLGRLKQMAMYQNQSAPSDTPAPDSYMNVGNYRMPVFGQADPNAVLPANAQMTAGQQPQNAIQPVTQPQQQAQSPSLGESLMAGLDGFANARGPLPAIAAAIKGFATGNSQENMTIKALTQRGLDPALAQTVAKDPTLLRAVLPQLMGTAGQTDDIKEYQFAKKEDPSLTFDKFMQKKRATSGEYSLTPIYGKDSSGNTVLIQPGKSGTAIQAKIPEGVTISSGVEKIDLGTRWGLFDKRAGQIVGYEPKDVAGKASQEAQGEIQGKAIAALPTVINTAEQSLSLIDEMIKHPGRETATGLSGTLDPRNYFGGTDAKNFQVRAKQMESRVFLDAFEQLRGAGAITEAEGQKATAARARLDTSQSDEEYLAALKELQSILHKGMGIARQRAGINSSAQPQTTTQVKADPLGIR